jgi:Leucine-rich repeat (LRR) protein
MLLLIVDVALKTLVKCANKKLNSVNLASLKLVSLPEASGFLYELQSLTDVNLSKNNLFNNEEVFVILSQLSALRRINLSENFLNGTLPDSIGSLSYLEELRMDLNQLVALPPTISQLTALRVLTISDNSLKSLPVEMANLVNMQVS